MRILYDHHAFSLQKVGGVTRYFSELMNHAPAGMECQLPLVLSNNLYLRDRRHTRHLSLWPDHLTELGGWRLLRWANQLAAERALRRGHFDVFHPTLNEADYFLDLLGGKPFVLTLHDLIPHLYPEYYPGTALEPLRQLARRASRLVAVSENTRQDALRLLGVAPEQVVTVHHGTTITRPGGPAPAVPAQYVLFAGVRRFYKNFGCVLEAFAQLRNRHPHLHLVCVGGGPFSAEELAQLQQLNLTDTVLPLGRVSDGALAHLYRGALAFVFPSRYEGFGLPILEAFAHGCPVVLSDTSCFPEIAQDAALYFDPDAPEQLAEHLARLLADAPLRRQLQQRGIRRGHDFTWNKAAAQTFDVYQQARDVSMPVLQSTL